MANGKSRKDSFEVHQYRSWKLETYFIFYLHQVFSWAQILGRETFLYLHKSFFFNFPQSLGMPSSNHPHEEYSFSKQFSWLTLLPFPILLLLPRHKKKILFYLDKFQDPHSWPFWSCVGVLKNSKTFVIEVNFKGPLLQV